MRSSPEPPPMIQAACWQADRNTGGRQPKEGVRCRGCYVRRRRSAEASRVVSRLSLVPRLSLKYVLSICLAPHASYNLRADAFDESVVHSSAEKPSLALSWVAAFTSIRPTPHRRADLAT
jgi:hypothetical protein